MSGYDLEVIVLLYGEEWQSLIPKGYRVAAFDFPSDDETWISRDGEKRTGRLDRQRLIIRQEDVS